MSVKTALEIGSQLTLENVTEQTNYQKKKIYCGQNVFQSQNVETRSPKLFVESKLPHPYSENGFLRIKRKIFQK